MHSRNIYSWVQVIVCARDRGSRLCLGMLCAVALLSAGCNRNAENSSDTGGVKKQSQPPAVAQVEMTPQQRHIKQISDSETLIQSLSGPLRLLAQYLRDSDTDLSSFMGETIQHTGIDPDFDLQQALSGVGKDGHLSKSVYLPLESGSRVVDMSQVWQPILANGRFSDSQIGVLKGYFSDDYSQFSMETKFEGRIGLRDGKLGGAKAHQTLRWQQNDAGDWNLVGWNQTDLKFIAAAKPLFEDVTKKAFPNPGTYDKITRSSHQEVILRHSQAKVGQIKDVRSQYKAFNDWESAYQYPAVSVVDIDRDGFDDIFLTDRWQSAQLLRNNGDGTFEDVTRASGLKVAELANCAYFADFDNDGDSDVFIGRTLAASKYFVNEGGVFRADEETNSILSDSRFVVSGSIVDVNQDGLLDLYLSTYAYGSGLPSEWANQTTRAEDRLKTRLKIERSHAYVDRHGPPNILLMNRGGKFEWSSIGDELKQFRNSYQTVWTDLDADGDRDVYLCNDFSPDVFLRNDTPQGSFEAKFVDITSEIAGAGAMGFGMGASWGDYNNDGDLDLYVSNMYSKAGNRIVAQIEGVDERITVSAHGNFLYENVEGKFKQVAGKKDSQQHVATVGWSFGGQFADFNNDGRLDIYVPCGFYSPPAQVRGDVDL
ncbi:MAG: VCBS repeat-containing protein [Pirellulaceae bacterium]|nr:VCBS repeat-containing protein [Pirellulaceae bacterium]